VTFGHGVLTWSRLYDDIVNSWSEYENVTGIALFSNDDWWRTASGRGVYYAGNQCGTQETTYYCYVLALWPVGLAAGDRSCDDPAALARPENYHRTADSGWRKLETSLQAD
jgi:hypothetical protein